jgi:hypothetical protein
MKIFNKIQMKELMKRFPNGGIVFAEYNFNVLMSELMVTNGEFGATEVIPKGEVFNFDWDIEEYQDKNLFAVFDNNDILQMIQTLTSGLEINLNFE